MSVINDTIKQVFRNSIPGIGEWISFYAPVYQVNTPKRMAAFLGQAAHESANFTTTKEFWSAKYDELKMYEGRKDLGNDQPGDGKKHLGRGIFQTTGKKNYLRASLVMFKDDRLLRNPELLEKPQWAVLSAFIFWNDNNLNALADKGDIVTLSTRVNGKRKQKNGRIEPNHLAERIALTAKFSQLLTGRKYDAAKDKGNPMATAEASATLGNKFNFFF